MRTLDKTLKKLRGARAEILLAAAAINILSLAFPIAMLQIYDRIIPHAATATLTYLSIALICAIALDFILSAARSYLSAWNAARIQHHVTCELVQHMFKSDLRAFESATPGVHLQRLRSIDTLKNLYAGQGLLLLVDMPFVFLFLGLIGLIGKHLVLVPIVIITVLAIAAHFASHYLEKALEDRRESDTRRYNFTIEVLKKIYTIKALGVEESIARRYELLQSNSATASQKVVDNGSWARDTGIFFSQLASIAVGGYGAVMVLNNSLTIGGLAACVLLTTRATQPMMRALGTWSQMRKGRIAKSQVEEILALPGETNFNVPPLVITTGQMELDDVTFSYSTTDQPIFSHVNFTVSPGEAVSIAGPSDSGKSSLLGIMMGTLSPTSGSVRIDQSNIFNFDTSSIRRQIVYLPQRPTLYQGSILENLTMFRGDAYNHAAMQMSERLGLHEAIGRMPQGYNTLIQHAANVGLSDSIRQCIALARALTIVEEPRIILFDEANGLLNETSNGLLLDILAEYKPSCSLVIISQDPKYLELCDRGYTIQNKSLVSFVKETRVPMDSLTRMFA